MGKPFSLMKYTDLVRVYKQLEATMSNLEKTDILAEAFKDASDDDLKLLVKLCMGRVFPAWQTHEIGISNKLMIKAIAKTTGIADDRIEDVWRDTGDLGDTAAQLVQNKKQQTLMDQTLTVQKVHANLQDMASYKGSGSQDRKIDEIAELLSIASPDEARYIVRTILGNMRVGVGEGTIRDGIAQAFFAEILRPKDIENKLEGRTAVQDELEDGLEVEPAETFTGDELDTLDLSRDSLDHIIVDDELYEQIGDRPKEAVQHGYDVTNDFAVVATTAKSGGIDELHSLSMELFRPINSMLAKKVETMEDGFDTVADEDGIAAIEFKYDGMRVQLHKKGDQVKVFTRRLEDITAQFPDIVSAVKDNINAEKCMLEGEAVAYDPDDQSTVPFQTLSKRIKRKYNIQQMVEEIPVVVHLFDITYLDGNALIDQPLRERWQTLQSITEEEQYRLDLARHIETDDHDEAQTFYQQALTNNQEGIMLKNMDAAYKPGSRVGYMVKLKPVMETLDLVIVEAEWGEGRRSDWMGSYTLACRDATDNFKVVGNMATGFTDKQLDEMTERLKPLITK
jgi:DNA ligase-1